MAPLGHDGKLPQRGHHEDAAADSWTTRSGRVPGSSRWPGSNGPSFPYGVDVEGALKKINNFILDKRCRCCCLSACKCDSRGPRGGAVTFCGGCVLRPGRFMFYSSVMSLSLSLSLALFFSVENILGINHEYVMRLQSFARSSRTASVAKTHARARTPRAGGSRTGLPATWGLHQARGPLGSPASSAHLCLHSLCGSWLVSAARVNPVQPGGRRARGEQLWLRAGGGLAAGRPQDLGSAVLSRPRGSVRPSDTPEGLRVLTSTHEASQQPLQEDAGARLRHAPGRKPCLREKLVLLRRWGPESP